MGGNEQGFYALPFGQLHVTSKPGGRANETLTEILHANLHISVCIFIQPR